MTINYRFSRQGTKIWKISQCIPYYVENFLDLFRGHSIVYAIHSFVVLAPDGLVHSVQEVLGGVGLARVFEASREAPHVVPPGLICQGVGEGEGTADDLGPLHAGAGVGGQQRGLPVAAFAAGDLPAGLRAEGVHQSGCFQQFPGGLEKPTSLVGERSRSFLFPGREAVGDDGWPHCLAEGEVGGQGGRSPFLDQKNGISSGAENVGRT